MQKIRKLPQDVIAKISAGEVIDCVASAIKELIENSIDAGAKNIKIEIEEIGLQKIQITDDGVGMTGDDLKECYKPHSTSKIYYEDDLVSISTLGFRGEALASISAISTLQIKSRPKDSLSGGVIEIKEGILTRSNDIGMPVGTSVVVKNLFENTPARKKFLKSSQSELRKILEVVVQIALANPEIGFFLASDKKIKIDLPSDQSLYDRIRMLLGLEFAKNLIPVEINLDHLKVYGYVGKPKISYINKNKQFLYVNKRSVKNNLVADAVKDSYGTTLMTKDQPVFVLFIELTPALIDVNIHPRKEEVLFAESVNIYQTIKTELSKIFFNEKLNFVSDALPKDETEYAFFEPQIDIFADNTESTYFSGPIFQLNNLYLLAENQSGIILIDQHAAHERILYEQFLDSFEKHIKVSKLELEEPTLVEFTLTEVEMLNEYKEIIEQAGFEVEEFGNLTFKINSIPYFIPEKNIGNVVKGILEDLTQGKLPKSVDQKTDRAISYIACKSAIKAGDYLSEDERLNLLSDLAKTRTEYTCPHGRPVKLEITWNELARMFRRK